MYLCLSINFFLTVATNLILLLSLRGENGGKKEKSHPWLMGENMSYKISFFSNMYIETNS